VGLGPENDCAGRLSSSCELQTPFTCQKGRPTSSNLQLSESNKNLVMGPRWVPDRKTDWPTDRQLQHNFGFDLIRTSIPDAGDSLQDTG
jgi:hypothetical protein